MERYRIKRVLEADYKPTDGEPFAAAWGKEGWVIFCRTPLHPGGRPAKAKVGKPAVTKVKADEPVKKSAKRITK